MTREQQRKMARARKLQPPLRLLRARRTQRAGSVAAVATRTRKRERKAAMTTMVDTKNDSSQCSSLPFPLPHLGDAPFVPRSLSLSLSFPLKSINFLSLFLRFPPSLLKRQSAEIRTPACHSSFAPDEEAMKLEPSQTEQPRSGWLCDSRDWSIVFPPASFVFHPAALTRTLLSKSGAGARAIRTRVWVRSSAPLQSTGLETIQSSGLLFGFSLAHSPMLEDF